MTALMDSLHLSAHFRLKERYSFYLKLAAFVAVSIHVLIAAFSPPYVPTPYQLREATLQVVDYIPEIKVPPKPKEIDRPTLPPSEAEIVDDAPMDLTIPPTDDVFPEPIPLSKPEGPFVAYDKLPEAVHRVAPEYPELARMAESEGTVVVLATVGETGRVVAAEIYESDATALLERAALEAVYGWLFKPAMQRDIPVQAQTTIRFNFSLD